ncbi:hypothetical protein BSKO_12552 [Bryopsis sp. KO-2023]|nr:hypothetical protein BSKO_12552 [Bryopsis sp. KO-2023]
MTGGPVFQWILANRTVQEILRSYVEPAGADWEEHLAAAEFAYNSSINATTGFSPFFLIRKLTAKFCGPFEVVERLSEKLAKCTGQLRAQSRKRERGAYRSKGRSQHGTSKPGRPYRPAEEGSRRCGELLWYAPDVTVERTNPDGSLEVLREHTVMAPRVLTSLRIAVISPPLPTQPASPGRTNRDCESTGGVIMGVVAGFECGLLSGCSERVGDLGLSSFW